MPARGNVGVAGTKDAGGKDAAIRADVARRGHKIPVAQLDPVDLWQARQAVIVQRMAKAGIDRDDAGKAGDGLVGLETCRQGSRIGCAGWSADFPA